MSLTIRPFEPRDWAALWPILESVFRAGETYAFSTSITEDEARAIWIDAPHATLVAVDDAGTVLGTYYIKPNHAGPGGHVCNCGYIVAPAARGRGVASALCRDSQERAVALGFRAMQFNMVASTNETAVGLWKKLGFAVVGTLPGAFHHPRQGDVDAFVMFKRLAAEGDIRPDARSSSPDTRPEDG